MTGAAEPAPFAHALNLTVAAVGRKIVGCVLAFSPTFLRSNRCFAE